MVKYTPVMKKDLDLTNANVAANTASLADKAEQVDVDLLASNTAIKFLQQKEPFIDTHAFDSFNRADSTTTLGTPETSTQNWNALSGTWGISGNQAYTPSGGLCLATLDYGLNNCVIETNMTVGSQCGLVFRVQDTSNFFYIRMETDSIRAYKKVAGTDTAIGSLFKVAGTFVNINLKVVLNNANIKIFIDGVLVIKAVDSTFLTQSIHGLYARLVDSSRFKTFSISSLRHINNLQITENFENGSLPWYWTIETPAQSYSQGFSTNFIREGTKSYRFELRSTDPDVSGSKRSEIRAPIEYPMEEHWYCMSIYLPNGGSEDYQLDLPSGEIVTQWHQQNDAGENISPCLSLLTGGSGKWLLHRMWDDARFTPDNTAMTNKGNDVYYDLGSWVDDKGKWIDWMFHVRWGWRVEQKPLLEVYKNGKLVLNANGLPNMTNDANGVYWKVGLYKWDWHTTPTPSTITKRIAYYDQLKIL
jgi:hypothetical protein